VEASAHTGSGQAFLVEHFRPGARSHDLELTVVRLRQTAAVMVAEGKWLRCVSSTIVPGDESLLCLFESAGEELVREAYARAGEVFERISSALDASGAGRDLSAGESSV
jgi:hypothetical protein